MSVVWLFPAYYKISLSYLEMITAQELEFPSTLFEVFLRRYYQLFLPNLLFPPNSNESARTHTRNTHTHREVLVARIFSKSLNWPWISKFLFKVPNAAHIHPSLCFLSLSSLSQRPGLYSLPAHPISRLWWQFPPVIWRRSGKITSQAITQRGLTHRYFWCRNPSSLTTAFMASFTSNGPITASPYITRYCPDGVPCRPHE